MAEKKVNPGKGYRLLKLRERIRPGDEHFILGSWGLVSGAIGGSVEDIHAPIRRKITAPK